MMREYITTPIFPLDFVIGGAGIPAPSIMMIYGVKDSGKSTIAQELPFYAVKKGNYKIFYIDSELKLDEVRLAYLANKHNVSLDKVIIIQTSVLEDIVKELTKAIDLAEANSERLFIVWDSIADIISEDKKKEGYAEAKITQLFESYIKPLAYKINKTKSIMLLVNQVRQNISQPNAGYKMKRGEFIKHKVNIIARITGQKQKVDYGAFTNVKADILADFTTEKNHLFTNGLSCKLYITEEGIDELRSIYESCKAIGVIGVKGSWDTVEFGDTIYKWQGFGGNRGFIKALEKEPKLLQILEYLYYKKVVVTPLQKIKVISRLNKLEEYLGLDKTELTDKERAVISQVSKNDDILESVVDNFKSQS